MLLSKSLASNRSLREFRLGDNFLTRECGYSIIDSVRSNETLFIFDLTATQIDHFVIKGLLDLCQRNRQIQKEVNLQPLKRELIQLSIQRTKLPEAEMRLAALDSERTALERQVVETESELETTQMISEANIKTLRKTIVETNQMVHETKDAIAKLSAEKEKMVTESDERMAELESNCTHERMLTETFDERASKIEAQVDDDAIGAQTKVAELQATIDQLRTLLMATIEATKDREKLRAFQSPEIPPIPGQEQHEPIFLVDQIEQLERAEGGSKKGTRKSPKKSGSAKGKGSPKRNGSPKRSGSPTKKRAASPT
jgi:myosin heavy subunit